MLRRCTALMPSLVAVSALAASRRTFASAVEKKQKKAKKAQAEEEEEIITMDANATAAAFSESIADAAAAVEASPVQPQEEEFTQDQILQFVTIVKDAVSAKDRSIEELKAMTEKQAAAITESSARLDELELSAKTTIPDLVAQVDGLAGQLKAAKLEVKAFKASSQAHIKALQRELRAKEAQATKDLAAKDAAIAELKLQLAAADKETTMFFFQYCQKTRELKRAFKLKMQQLALTSKKRIAGIESAKKEAMEQLALTSKKRIAGIESAKKEALAAVNAKLQAAKKSDASKAADIRTRKYQLARSKSACTEANRRLGVANRALKAKTIKAGKADSQFLTLKRRIVALYGRSWSFKSRINKKAAVRVAKSISWKKQAVKPTAVAPKQPTAVKAKTPIVKTTAVAPKQPAAAKAKKPVVKRTVEAPQEPVAAKATIQAVKFTAVAPPKPAAKKSLRSIVRKMLALKN